jgi:hypothetical protein
MIQTITLSRQDMIAAITDYLDTMYDLTEGFEIEEIGENTGITYIIDEE